MSRLQNRPLRVIQGVFEGPVNASELQGVRPQGLDPAMAQERDPPENHNADPLWREDIHVPESLLTLTEGHKSSEMRRIQGRQGEGGGAALRLLRQEHTKPKFSHCVPHRRLKLVVGARRSVGPSDHSDWLFRYCHLLVQKGISSYAGAERTCYLAVGCLALVWCVRPTLDTDAADVSQPRSLLSSPLVRRRWLGVFRPLGPSRGALHPPEL
ncbi:hypothetical protein DPX16_3449 [Anabarilius grahami]|uniref:Uncharacterized protein n=1 Tax=Anabarilius grahami TaxID=495550 RepID=A0A3N0XKK3_ANAGA|nr:hypothetical protein DPX16_3449 [Anabarilius grahami]